MITKKLIILIILIVSLVNLIAQNNNQHKSDLFLTQQKNTDSLISLDKIKLNKVEYIKQKQKLALLRAVDSIKLNIDSNLNNTFYDIDKQNTIIEKILEYIKSL
jgi:hypothetical protein